MKNSTYKNLSEILRTKVVLGVAAGLLLVSCGSQMGGYTETDGVYYDPNKDVIPEGIVMPEPNQVDEVYAYESDSASIIKQNQLNQAAKKTNIKLGTEQNLTGELTQEQNKTSIITIIILGVGILTDIILLITVGEMAGI